jgi:hypothetical protein
MKLTALLLLLCVSAIGQSKTTGTAEAKGACSTANTGNNNTFEITCGIGKEQGDQILKLLNQILADHLDPSAVMTMLENIQSQLKTSGTLGPDTRPDPEFPFPVAPDPSILSVLLGKSLVSVEGEKCTVIQIADKPVLWIERSNNGLLVSARVFGPDSRILAEIDRNNVTVNPNNTFKRKIEKHRLVVVDESDQEVLSVDFVNPRIVVIAGIFHQRGYGKLVVDREAIRDPRNDVIKETGVFI